MHEKNGDIVVNAETNLTVTIRDDDTGSEVQTKLGVFTRVPEELRNKVFKTVDVMLKDLGVIENAGSRSRPGQDGQSAKE